MKGGFQVKRWLSNRSLENKILKLEKPKWNYWKATQEKVLGTVWNHAEDVLLFSVKLPKDITLTKRAILSQIARIFDPVGFAAAFLVRAKIGMQHLWQQGLDWYQELPSPKWKEWACFSQEMGDLNHVTFKRSLTSVDAIQVPTLFIFSDASNEAFKACAYIRWRTGSNKYDTRFIAAKSRVAQLKLMTIPHLEQQAAVHGHQAIPDHNRGITSTVWKSSILLRQQYHTVMDLQWSERVQAFCVRPELQKLEAIVTPCSGDRCRES